MNLAPESALGVPDAELEGALDDIPTRADDYAGEVVNGGDGDLPRGYIASMIPSPARTITGDEADD
jgi:hypothetical protein